MNHARRQQYRRVSRAGRLALTSVPAAILGLYLLAAGAAVPGAALLVLAIMLGLGARHWLSLAARSGIGARSEDEVQRPRPASPSGMGSASFSLAARRRGPRLGGDRTGWRGVRD